MACLEETTPIVQLKVRLLGVSPMIWRRVLVPISVSLRELHGILQVSMGWKGIHLSYFDIYAVGSSSEAPNGRGGHVRPPSGGSGLRSVNGSTGLSKLGQIVEIRSNF